MSLTRYLFLAVVLGVVFHFASRVPPRLVPAHPELTARTEGEVKEGSGWYPGKPYVTTAPVRAWGSWAGSDDNTGSLVLGPFRIASHLCIGVSGYPSLHEVYLERVATRERYAVPLGNVGEKWEFQDRPVPLEWRGELVTLHAIDKVGGPGGWIGLTEPIHRDTLAPLFTSLATWVLNTVLLALLWFAAAALLPRLVDLPAPWQPLAATALVAFAAYLAFWAFFAHVLLGKVFTYALLLGAIVVLIRIRKTPQAAESSRAFRDIARLGLVVSFFYLALLHLFPSSLDFYSLAANRFRHTLPSDNYLPYANTTRLMAGESMRDPPLGGSWLSSDRPPLQSGWQLLTLPVSSALSLDPVVASGTSSIWFQLAWIPAVYGLLHALGLSAVRSVGWIAALAFTGFFLQNSVFTWPKLSAAAFACGAFALWVFPRERTLRSMLAGAALAALAWLSHGGVAFSFLALFPWILWRMARGEWRPWLAAGVVFFVLAAPWIAYQRFYEPPGNRLLKWHLAGQMDVDPRGLGQTLRENYAKLTWSEILANRRSNFEQQVIGDWRSLFDVSFREIVTRRNAEFFHPARALAWWAFALLLAPFAIWRIRSSDTLVRGHASLLLWTVVTVIVWCLLMFLPASAYVHQGSYATMMGAFVLLSAWFDRAGRFALLVVALFQLATFLTTWAPASPIVGGDPQSLPFVLTIAGGAALFAFIVAALRPPPAPVPA
ncbi:MAG: hypothetical protein V4773_08140 [Verrucomicrobiota bacterium]